MIVFDSSAVLALLLGETGADHVASRRLDGIMSSVNYVEVVTRLIDYGVPEAEAVEATSALNLPVVAFDEQQAATAAALRRQTRAAGLSLGDRACLALAIREQSPTLTADRRWAMIEISVDIQFIR